MKALHGITIIHGEGVYHACQLNHFLPVRGGRWQKLQDMSESQLKARRATRAKAVLERGEILVDVELV